MWLPALAETTIAETTIKDAELQTCLQDIAKKNNWSKPADFIEIKCHSKGIQSLSGLENYSNVTLLSFHNNKLPQLDIDLTQFPLIKEINLARNNIKKLILSDIPTLEAVYVFGNGLQHLEVHNLTNIQVLRANNNKIEFFDYSNAPNLNKIYIFNNKLESINIHDLPAMQYMDCRENPMPDELYDEMDRMEGITFLHDGNAEDW